MKLKNISILILAFCSTSLLLADEQPRVQIQLSMAEVQEMFDNPTCSYIYVGRDVSNLADIIAEISKLDSEENSPVKALEAHINNGFVIGHYDGVAQALEHAESFLNRIEPDRTSDLSRALNAIVEQVAAEQLTLDAEMLEAAHVQAPETKACGSCNSHCLRKLIIKEKANFLNKVKFYEDVTFKDEVTFEDNVTIEGTLSVTDLVVLSCMDSLCVGTLTVADIITPAGSCLDLCFNTLSVTEAIITNATITTLSSTDAVIQNLQATNASITDGTITGTLSVNNEIATNLTTTSLSSTDAVIQNLQATNASIADGTVTGTLSVNNEIATNLTTTSLSSTDAVIQNLQATNVSITDGTITGTLSVNNEIATNLTATTLSATDEIITNSTITHLSAGDEIINSNLTVGSNISMSDSLSASIGNIVKGGNTFLSNFGTNNTFVGQNSGNFTMTGANNSGFGTNALIANTTGQNNTALGYNTLVSNSTGQNNTAVGVNALNANVVDANTAVGSNTLAANTTGFFNTAIGVSALQNNITGFSNTAVGYQALMNSTLSVNNTAIGTQAMLANTTGDANVAIGTSSLLANTTGRFNTAVGFDSLINSTTGSDNIGLGFLTLQNLTTGNNNVAVGNSSGSALVTGSNNIYIGSVTAASAGESNVTRIANIRGTTTGVADAIAVLIDSTGQLGTVNSSKSVKSNIQPMNDISVNIYDLNPVTFTYNSDASETTQYGLIAEEVADVFPGIVVRNANGQPETVQYHVLPVLLLNEVKKLAARLAVVESHLIN